MERFGQEKWRFDALTRGALSAMAPRATVVVPLGSVEQHGHHLPVRTDTTLVTRLSELAVARASKRIPVLLTPTVPFGFAHHHLQFGGTISLESSTYIALLTDIVTSLSRVNFRKVVFLNGHGGNTKPMDLVADRIVNELCLDTQIAAVSYWDAAREALEGAGLMGPQVPGHAGHFETSVLLTICPELVRLQDRPIDDIESQPIGLPQTLPGVVRRPDRWEQSDGRSDDARNASAAYGAEARDVIAAAVAAYIETFHAAGAGPQQTDGA